MDKFDLLSMLGGPAAVLIGHEMPVRHWTMVVVVHMRSKHYSKFHMYLIPLHY